MIGFFAKNPKKRDTLTGGKERASVHQVITLREQSTFSLTVSSIDHGVYSRYNVPDRYRVY